MSFSFNGTKKNYLKATIKSNRPPWATLKRNVSTIDGVNGGYLTSTTTDVRTIKVEVTLTNDGTFSSLQKLKEDFASWIITENEVPLIFDDESDRTYYAAVDGGIDLEEHEGYCRGTLTFICTDPYKYGKEKTTSGVNSVELNVGGSIDAEPIITATVNSDVTYVAIGNGEVLNMIGQPAKQEETPTAPETKQFDGQMNTTTGWATSTISSVSGATILGTMKSNGDSFYTDTFGVDANNWHGPFVKKSLNKSVQDFRFDAGFGMHKTAAGQAGGIRIYLLDANNQVIVEFDLTKHFGEIDTLYSKIRAGDLTNGVDIITEGGEANFNKDFSGVFRAYRTGNKWTVQIFRKVNGVFSSPITRTWIDYDGIAAAAVTQVQVGLIQRTGFPVTSMTVSDIYCYEQNALANTAVPIIASAGDIIVFDHSQDLITINGMDATKYKAFIGDYFSLKPGDVSIDAEPAGSISSLDVRWAEKWR